MCSANQPLLWVGWVLELAGLGLLALGVVRLRKELDPDYSPFWERLTGRPPITRTVTDRMHTTDSLVISPGEHLPEDEDDPKTLAREAFRILAGRIESLRGESQAGRDDLSKVIADERRERKAKDDEIRDGFVRISLGGLVMEKWALALIALGLTVTFAASICL